MAVTIGRAECFPQMTAAWVCVDNAPDYIAVYYASWTVVNMAGALNMQ